MKDSIELYSFDVFDTLITRKTALPNGIFLLVQEKIKDSLNFPYQIKEKFASIRMQAENAAREYSKQNYNTREINLDDIYSKIQKTYKLSDEIIKALKEIEIKTEIENSIPIEENISKLKELISKNKKVILISDMYLPSYLIRKLLVSTDNVFKNLKIYVSNEYKASKSTGELYKIISKEEEVKYKNWCHTGDNINSDYKSAKKLGIKAVVYNGCSLKEHEKDLLKTNFNEIEIQKQIGTARYTRLYSNKNMKNYDKYELGVSYAAPLLYNYVCWVLETALNSNFKTLYFVARDGYILKIIADIIIKKQNLPIKTKYIYGSRLAWRIPSRENYEKIIKNIFIEGPHEKTLELLSYRLGVSCKTLIKYLPVKSINETFKQNKKEKIKNIFLYNDLLKNEIFEESKPREEMLKKYIKQEIDLDEKDIVFVDVNGSGLTTDFLSEYINKIIPSQIHIFFAKTINENSPENIAKRHSYYTRSMGNNVVSEMLCRTTHGQTMGYYEENGKILPKLEKIDSSKIIDWGFKEYVQGIKDFIYNISQNSINQNCVELCYGYYDYVEKKCDKKLAQVLGDIPFLRLGKERKMTKAAPKLSGFKILLYYLIGNKAVKDIEVPKLSLFRSNVKLKGSGLFDIKYSLEYVSELRLYKYLRKLENKKIVLWGASIFLQDFIKKYNVDFDNIVAIVDKNIIKKGDTLSRYSIISPSELKKIDFEYILLTVKNRNSIAYAELRKFVNDNFKKKILLPNIFDNSISSILGLNNRKEKISVQNIENKIQTLENNLNRVIQTNLSTFMLHQKTFLQFKNKYNDKEIVILATGPSAKLYEPIKDAIHIGVNRAFELNKNLDYIFIQDYSGKTSEYIGNLCNYNPENCVKFFGLTDEWIDYPNRVIPETYALKANALRYRTDWANISNFKSEFTYDISSQPLGCFGSITFPALQFALWTNPKKIYLVGCDCTCEGYAYNAKESNELVVDYVIEAYKKFKEFANRYYPGTEIVSINPIGLKGIFKDVYQNRTVIKN